MEAQDFLSEHPYEVCFRARLGYLDFFVTSDQLIQFESDYGPFEAKALI